MGKTLCPQQPHLINVVLWVVVLITFAARTPGNLDNARIFTFSRLFEIKGRGKKKVFFFFPNMRESL